MATTENVLIFGLQANVAGGLGEARPPRAVQLGLNGGIVVDVAASNGIGGEESLETLNFETTASTIVTGTLKVNGPVQWTESDAPAGNVRAAATRAAPGAGSRNIIQAFAFTLSGAGPSFQDIRVEILDGVGGAVLFQSYIYKPPGASSVTIALSGLNLQCGDDTATVAQFSAASGDVNCFESVSLHGITVDTPL